MRTLLITLTAALSLAAFAAVSAAGPVGGGDGGSAGGGGGGHGGGGGGGHGGGAYGAGHASSGFAEGRYAAHGGYVAHGADGLRGGYGIVGFRAAGLGHGDAALRDGHGARNTLVVGPQKGSAAKAVRVAKVMYVANSSTRPHKPKHPHLPQSFYNNCQPHKGCVEHVLEIPQPICFPAAESEQILAGFDCPRAVKTTVPH